MKRDEIRQMAIEAGFDEYADWLCLSGNSEDDCLVAVQEFPVGEAC